MCYGPRWICASFHALTCSATKASASSKPKAPTADPAAPAPAGFRKCRRETSMFMDVSPPLIPTKLMWHPLGGALSDVSLSYITTESRPICVAINRMYGLSERRRKSRPPRAPRERCSVRGLRGAKSNLRYVDRPSNVRKMLEFVPHLTGLAPAYARR